MSAKAQNGATLCHRPNDAHMIPAGDIGVNINNNNYHDSTMKPEGGLPKFERESTIFTNPSAIKQNSDVLRYIQYEQNMEDEYLTAIRRLISRDLSEPYSIYVYRYFLYQWGHLCYLTVDRSNSLIGVVISKLERHRSGTYRGYIAMLAVEEPYRGQGIATRLVCMAVQSMKERGADEVVLETEVSNTASLRLYERLGFLRSKRLHRYYLNGNTAFRLVLCLKVPDGKDQDDY